MFALLNFNMTSYRTARVHDFWYFSAQGVCGPVLYPASWKTTDYWKRIRVKNNAEQDHSDCWGSCGALYATSRSSLINIKSKTCRWKHSWLQTELEALFSRKMFIHKRRQ